MRNSSLLCWLQLFSCSVWVWEKLVVLFVFEEGNISCALSWFVVASLLPSHIPSSLSSTTNVLTVCGRVRLVTEFIYLILNQPSNSLIGAVPPLGNEGKWTIKLVFVGNDVCLCVAWAQHLRWAQISTEGVSCHHCFCSRGGLRGSTRSL